MKHRFFEYLMENKIEIEYDVYGYALIIIERYLTVLCFVLPIAYILNIFLETTIFIIISSFLRKYLGGFHFNNRWICLLFSVSSSIFIPYLAANFPVANLYLILSLLIIILILTMKIGPIDHKNKQASYAEIESYKKKALNLEIAYALILLVCSILDFHVMANIFLYTMIFNTVSIISASKKTVKI